MNEEKSGNFYALNAKKENSSIWNGGLSARIVDMRYKRTLKKIGQYL